MNGAPELALVLKVWLFFVFAIAILANSKLAATKNHHAERKLAADIPGFISIDCGTDEDSIDKETGIPYKFDKELVNTGIVQTISPNWSGYITQQLKTLRSFPVGSRNCYTLRPEQAKNNNYMIRAQFLYGNYDGKNQTPIFDLYLGANWWTTMNSSGPVYSEIIYAPSTDYIDVCLVKTGDGVPFISSLELRHLDNSIYQTQYGALSNVMRYDIGEETGTKSPVIRYPDDVYDRQWMPLLFDSWIPIATNLTIYSQGNDNTYRLPAAVLRTAAKTPNATTALNIYWNTAHSLSKFYVYFHFAEIEMLGAGQRRELTITLNNESNLIYMRESVKLDYLHPLTIVQNDPPISGTQIKLSINASGTTMFPPILNAFEIFALKELPNKPTAIGDVEGIMEIRERYTVIRNWQGDPCVPSEYSWDGLNCSNDNSPRIISLNLSSSKLAGEIAASFSNLKALQSLDLSYNDLTGPFPEFFAQLTYLNTLDLSGNKLTGSIPEALVQKARDGKFVVRVGDNPDLYETADSAPSKRIKKKNKFVIPVVASSIVVLILLLLLIFGGQVKNRRR
ncbi:putative leucine-rich repeat receptor-like serine/threonine-protein kinase At2g19230 [Corylus avellana]|uniref:putative leucine-rich repeat receptor-like serine/threonine-protein kinase At2g19230 n=1 Tax=Corylus avellana TaxID=13451 RepID=UPI00286AD1BA|nr:putative leucine-rich repeat receptor-like serine/threonine-protein kinase At2g19230 [Corylus avellana]